MDFNNLKVQKIHKYLKNHKIFFLTKCCLVLLSKLKMNKVKQAVLLALLAGISIIAGREISGSKLQQNNFPAKKTLEKVVEQETAPMLTKATKDFSSFEEYLRYNFSQDTIETENNKNSAYITPSQAAVDSVINADLKSYHETGTGLYVGRPVNHSRGIQISGNYIHIDCVDAIKLVLNAEMPPEEVRKVMVGSRDRDGNFSAPFMIKYLVKKKGWKAYGYYDENEENHLKKGKITNRDLMIGRDRSGKPFYRSGELMFFLEDFFPRAQADSLFKRLTLERGYGFGFQRGGEHCFVDVQRGLFEAHLNTLPLGYESGDAIDLRPWEIHPGRYFANSSIAVFAFPPK